MASRKMTFTIPEDLAGLLLKRVPARDRSRYVTAAIAEKLRERDRQLAHACDVANRDPEILAIERDFDALPDEIDEEWTDAPAR